MFLIMYICPGLPDSCVEQPSRWSHIHSYDILQWNVDVDCRKKGFVLHYNDVIMGAMASQITSLMIVYSAVYSDADQRKYQSSASLAFVRWIHQSTVNSPHKWPVTRKMFPFDDVIMKNYVQGSCFVVFCCVLLRANLPISFGVTPNWVKLLHPN